MKFTSLLLLLLTLPLFSVAQYSYYSDVVQNQIYDNPASIGAEGTSRLRYSMTDNNKTYIFGSPIITHLHYDNGIVLPNANILAYGIGLSQEVSKEFYFKTHNLSAKVAYHMLLGKSKARRQYLTFGTSLQLGRLRSSYGVTTPYGSTIGGSTQPTPIQNAQAFSNFMRSGSLLSLDMGLMYSYYGPDNSYLKLGLAYQDMGQSTYDHFVNYANPLSTSAIISALGQINVAGPVYLEPHFRYLYLPVEGEIIALGSNIKFRMAHNSWLIAGASYTTQGLYSTAAGVDINRCRVVLSYGTKREPSVYDFQSLEINLAYMIDRGIGQPSAVSDAVLE